MIREIEPQHTYLTRVGSSMTDNELTVAGMVTDTKQGTTKKGKPFGILTLQDHVDTHKFVMFDVNYINNSKYFTKGYLLLIKGNLKPKYRNNDEKEFVVKEIHLLSSVRKRLVEIFEKAVRKRLKEARQTKNRTAG